MYKNKRKYYKPKTKELYEMFYILSEFHFT